MTTITKWLIAPKYQQKPALGSLRAGWRGPVFRFLFYRTYVREPPCASALMGSHNIPFGNRSRSWWFAATGNERTPSEMLLIKVAIKVILTMVIVFPSSSRQRSDFGFAGR